MINIEQNKNIKISYTEHIFFINFKTYYDPILNIYSDDEKYLKITFS